MAFKRNIYLESMDLEEALELYYSKIDTESYLNENYETLMAKDALGRTTAMDITASISSPHYNSSAMDGIAVNSKATYGASETNFIQLEESQYVNVDTGDPLDDVYNAVIPIEEVIVSDDDDISITKAYYPYQNVRSIGEDISYGEMVLPQGSKIKPQDIGVLINTGNHMVSVARMLKVGVMPTGTEIVDPGSTLKPGDIIESNSSLLSALLQEDMCIPKAYPITEDDYGLLKERLVKAIDENDIVLINAGSSAGSEDYTKSLISELGEVFVHGINIKPGKPAVLGQVKGKPVIGVPGFPGSAYLVYELAVRPLIDRYYARSSIQETIKATISTNIISSVKSREYIRVKLGRVGDNIVASALPRGAGILSSLSKSDGTLIIPKNKEGFKAGESVEIIKMPGRNLENSLVSNGSHDMLLDKIQSILSREGIYFGSTHSGSLGGIMAMKGSYAHIAPVHLLDPETGDYNMSYLRKYFPGGTHVLIKGVKRTQGFIVSPGNPMGIKSVADLTRENVVFVNRQRGSGTRVLLDYLLSGEGVDPKNISGYDSELSNHLMVAAAVRSSVFKVGIGIKAAADALELDFIPIGDEHYDFIARKDFLDDARMIRFLEALRSDQLKEHAYSLGGYEFVDTGEILEV